MIGVGSVHQYFMHYLLHVNLYMQMSSEMDVSFHQQAECDGLQAEVWINFSTPTLYVFLC